MSAFFIDLLHDDIYTPFQVHFTLKLIKIVSHHFILLKCL
ncbi:hypothetical protein CCC_03121 [Paramagnetospirillum magnetotacticum MS-1]|uniref:Uncharacterized protein n=1 Tax=Paramagnetospirillum magnetotacticum MS-1 TaxID=272627 RepID=A0A0C2YZK7_PARME|nr:hypothetical protein CCC_03121 [Paramagnetospirillum magnetotacticum MS-1]